MFDNIIFITINILLYYKYLPLNAFYIDKYTIK